MYKTKNTTPEELAKVKLKHQKTIKRYLGEELNLDEAFRLIKEKSKGFSKADAELEEADRLLYGILNGKSQELPDQTTEAEATQKLSKEAIRIRQQQQASELTLLELELELEME